MTTSPSRSPPARRRRRTASPISALSGWNTPDNAGAGNTGDLNGDGTPDNTTWGLVTEVKEVVQDRAAVAGALQWRMGESMEMKFDALWSQYEISEDQFQAWYGNNITGNWANGNSDMYNGTGAFCGLGQFL